MFLFSKSKSCRSMAAVHPVVYFCAPALLLVSTLGCGGNAAGNSPLPAQTPVQSPQTSTTTPSDPGSSSSGGDSQSNGPSSAAQIPAGAVTHAAVQKDSGWQWCTAQLNGHVCASGLGIATSSITQDQQTPSLSGASSEFKIGGHTHYSNALWWKSFGADSTSTHFVYDLDFYMDDPNLPEALEFDINQSMDGVRYTWGTECSYRDTGHWDIWNPERLKWETTSVACPVVSAQTWHHLTWQVERVNGQVHYISVTLDGNVMPVDKYYNPQQHFDGENVNVAFQMDGDYRQDAYSVWLDNVSLSTW